MKKRLLCGALALLLALGCVLPAGAYEVPASYDETYYATLDYYGGLQDASVVKSYRLNGQSSITDYGVYDQVINLTDRARPTVGNGKVVFTPEDAQEGRFYFEAKTRKPYEELPWTIAVSYRLNGAPIRAEELAGRTGLVEILLDVTSNPRASAYSKTNLALTAATAFNDDDITSLEAPGAEVQLVGNLRLVLFMVLPGEEQHFSIRVGSESFESAGLFFMAVPATLAQLDQVADLREAKEETEDAADAMSQSLDVILDTLEGMSGSLDATAGGLDRLNSARGTVSARKEDIYAAADGLHDLDSARATVSAGRDSLSQSTDTALAGLDGLAPSLARLDRYGNVTIQAVDDTVAILNDLNATLQGLSVHLEQTRKAAADLRSDTENLSALLDDVEAESDEAVRLAENLTSDLRYMLECAEGLQADLEALERALRLTTGLTTLSQSDLLGLLSEEEQAQMKEVLALHSQYESYRKANGLTEEQLPFEDFIVLAAYQQFCQQTVEAKVAELLPDAAAQAVAAQSQAAGRALTDEEVAAVQARTQEALTEQAQAQLPTLEQFKATEEAQPCLQQARQASAAYDSFAQSLGTLDAVNGKIREVNSLVTSITRPTAQVVDELVQLCREAENTNLEDDLNETAELCQRLVKVLRDHKGEGGALLAHADEVGDVVSAVTTVCDDLLGHTDRLVALVNDNTPDVRQAVADVTALSQSLQTVLRDTSAALKEAKGLLGDAWPALDAGMEKTLNGLSTAVDAVRAADGDLDDGTRAALSGLAAALREATEGLAQTSVIRDAKTTTEDLIADQWDQHTGEVDALLNIDPQATPVSMTSSRNAAPQNVQYILRTQAIQIEEPEEGPPEAQEEASPSLWQRIVALFKGIWADFLSLFHNPA